MAQAVGAAQKAETSRACGQAMALLSQALSAHGRDDNAQSWLEYMRERKAELEEAERRRRAVRHGCVIAWITCCSSLVL